MMKVDGVRINNKVIFKIYQIALYLIRMINHFLANFKMTKLLVDRIFN